MAAARVPPMDLLMETLSVECLRCGDRRDVRTHAHRAAAGECARCGYLGWARSDEISEATRRVLRDRPVELRRLRPVW